jgi:hypothetical protein
MEERAESRVNFESPEGANDKRPTLVPDPLERLEAELGQADGAQSGDERMYKEAQSLVEEAWSVLTECLGIRDGLLEACREVEEAMGSMQRRLGALSVAIDAEGPEPSASLRSSASNPPPAAGANGSVAR